MLRQRAYKTELDLNNEQITACKKHAGAARWAYNYGLARRIEVYKATGKAIWSVALGKEVVAHKHSDLPWLGEVSKCAPQEALRDLDEAYRHFFWRCQLKKEGKLKGKVGFPQFKTKKRGLGSFRLYQDIHIFEDAIQLPRLGRLRLKEKKYLPTPEQEATILFATVSEKAGRWYVSVQVAENHEVPENTGPVVGVDLGLKNLATLSDGTVIPNPRHLTSSLKKLKRLNRRVSRRKKGGKNRKKAVKQVANQHRKVANLRANTLHQITSRLAKTKSVVVLEDLNVQGMMKNHHLVQAIGDVDWYEFRRQLTYKAAWYGCHLILADRWMASSKTCSCCGWYDAHLELKDRVFICRNPDRPDCGLVLDRDLNAALNLARLAESSSDTQNACGVGSAGSSPKRRMKLPTKRGAKPCKKQEPSTRRGLSIPG